MRRPKQVPPNGDWLTWLILAGRGWGKTRVGGEWVIENHHSYGRFLLAGRTSGDLRDIMIEGESGILNIAHGDDRPQYEPSKRRLTWANGCIATLRSADEPEGFRGLQADAVWADELAAWEHPEAWDQLQFGFRLQGEDIRQLITTTPKPTPLIRELVAQERTAVTRGSTYENRENLAPSFFTRIVSRYEGTRLGRQELYAEILEDIEGALWTRSMFRYGDAPFAPQGGVMLPDYTRVVVAIDPAVSYGPDSDETGIVACAVHGDAGFVINDLSGRFSPRDWAKRAIAAYEEHRADAIVAEVNNGGDLVEANLRAVGFTGRFIRVTASRGKRTRAEPVAALYEQGRIRHIRPFPELEDQLCTFTPDTLTSPDRLDALVWAFTELLLGYEVSGDFSMIA